MVFGYSTSNHVMFLIKVINIFYQNSCNPSDSFLAKTLSQNHAWGLGLKIKWFDWRNTNTKLG